MKMTKRKPKNWLLHRARENVGYSLICAKFVSEIIIWYVAFMKETNLTRN